MHSQVAVTRRDVVTINIDFDVPTELTEALRNIEEGSTSAGERVAHVIVVNIGGNKVGTINPYNRMWRNKIGEVY